MKLLIKYFQEHKKKSPASLLLSDLTYESVVDFLLSLEKIRKVSVGQAHLFTSNRGSQMSSDSVQFLLRKYIKIAAKAHPSLEGKKKSPHSLRHATAMQLLDFGVDVQIIALWLGHEQIETTQVYFSESLAIKRKALKKTRLTLEMSFPANKKSEVSFLDDI